MEKTAQQAQQAALAAARQMAEQAVQTLNAEVMTGLAEPLAKLFTDFKGMCENALKTLPGAEEDGSTMGSYAFASLLTSLSNAVSYIGNLNSAMKRITAELAETKNSLPVEVEKALAARLPGAVATAIEAKAKAGELLDKATVNSLVEAGKVTALAEGRKAAQDEAAAAAANTKLVSDRTALCTTNSLPVPDEKILTLPEAQFKPLFDTAKTRAAALARHGLRPDNKLMVRVFNAADDFAALETLVADILTDRGPSPEPLATPARASAGATLACPI